MSVDGDYRLKTADDEDPDVDVDGKPDGQDETVGWFTDPNDDDGGGGGGVGVGGTSFEDVVDGGAQQTRAAPTTGQTRLHALNVADDFYDGVPSLAPWVEAWMAQQRAAHRVARGQFPEGEQWILWAAELGASG